MQVGQGNGAFTKAKLQGCGIRKSLKGVMKETVMGLISDLKPDSFASSNPSSSRAQVKYFMSTL